MVVQHNLRAMNSNRMLGLTTATQAKSTEKLSSGYKINRAADDAAGLSISEKMRKQIRGLTQASMNAQDGISAVQTAEGALTEVHDMLQRMNELAVKSANGTNSVDDRSYIQSEINALVDEIDRVAETTKFNETYLLKGDDTKPTKEVYAYKQITTDASVTYGDGLDFGNFGIVEEPIEASAKGSAGLTVTIADEDKLENADLVYADGRQDAGGNTITAGWYHASDLEDAEAADDGATSIQEVTLADLGVSVAGTPDDGATLTLKAASDGGYKTFASKDEMLTALANKDTIYKGDENTEAAEEDYTYTKGSSTMAMLYTVDGNAVATSDIANLVKNGTTLYSDKEGQNEADVADFTTKATVTGDLELNLHVGADSTENNKIGVTIASMSAAGIGVDGLDVSTEDSATNAVNTISAAIKAVSKQRSDLGAVQNRLEHTINNLDNVVENTTAAESQIRDTDMATEMVKYSNNNILAQAGQAMLAQSNQANQGVLSLLQ